MSRSKNIGLAPFLEYITQLHRAVHAVGLFVDVNFGPELSQPEALVLVQLLSAGASTINNVHRTFLHRRSTLTSVLDRLESKGLIAREPSSADRRTIEISLTEKGRRRADHVASALADLKQRIGLAIDGETIALLEATAQAAASHE